MTIGPGPNVIGVGVQIARVLGLLKRAGYDVKVHIAEQAPEDGF